MSTLKKKKILSGYSLWKLWETLNYTFDEIRTLKVAILDANKLPLPSHHFSNSFFADEPLFSCVCSMFTITMEENSSVKEFILLGLTQDLLKEKVVPVTFLFLYLGTLLASFLIVMTARCGQTLQSPMYFFLFYLSFADACLSTTTAPRLIVDSVSEKKAISYNECMTQMFAFHFFGCMGILVLVLMSFDRYVAICKPLWFTTIMSQHVCGHWWDWSGWGLVSILQHRFSWFWDYPSVAPMSLITISVICNLCWNLPVWILMSSTYS